MAETRIPGSIIKDGSLPSTAVNPADPPNDNTKLPLAGGTMTGPLVMDQAGISVQSLVSDPYTKYLLHMDGASGSTGVIDEVGHTADNHDGSMLLDGATMVFGTASLNCAGIAENAVIFAPSVDHQFGTGDWTIDAWVNFNSVPTELNAPMIIAFSSNGTTEGWVFMLVGTGAGTNLQLALVGPGPLAGAAAGWTVPLNTWAHVAAVKYGTDVNVYVDGVSIASYSGVTAAYDGSHHLQVCGVDGAPATINGHMDEFRLSKGIARWTGNFTPPTEPYILDTLEAVASINNVGTVSASAFVGDGSALTGVIAPDASKLPLAGGTLTGSLGISGATFTVSLPSGCTLATAEGIAPFGVDGLLLSVSDSRPVGGILVGSTGNALMAGAFVVPSASNAAMGAWDNTLGSQVSLQLVGSGGAPQLLMDGGSGVTGWVSIKLSGDMTLRTGDTGDFIRLEGNVISTGTVSAAGFSGDGSALTGVMKWSEVPDSAGATGSTGDVAYDATHFYLCVGENSWVGVTMENVW